MTNSGTVLWITGLSGAGKTTVSSRVQEFLRSRKVPALLIDGDRMREALRDPTYGYDRESRLAGARRYARFAKMVADQGFAAIVSTISLFHEVHDWNRANLPGYFEVFLDVPEEVRRARDPKGLYAAHVRGDNGSMGGLDLAVELPRSPDLRLDNSGDENSIDTIADRIVDAFLERFPEGIFRR
ncbi:MAG TPA: adenylyl-sulfate kinase [Fibrobacteria bacterium]|nr:adenylyl-sulfate kinase [Fibrobacteria bacterium]